MDTQHTPVRRAIYPGTFDPVTYGHLDIIERSSKIFDEVIVGMLVNTAKAPMFSEEERVAMMRESLQELALRGVDTSRIRVVSFAGLLIDFARAQHAGFIVRGLRAVTDFEYELQMTQTNKVLAPDIDTIFLTTSLKYSYLSSSTVKELASFGADISRFVPEMVRDRVHEKYHIERGNRQI